MIGEPQPLTDVREAQPLGSQHLDALAAQRPRVMAEQSLHRVAGEHDGSRFIGNERRGLGIR